MYSRLTFSDQDGRIFLKDFLATYYPHVIYILQFMLASLRVHNFILIRQSISVRSLALYAYKCKD